MHKNEELIKNFYQAFQSGDAATMVNSYDDKVEFSDPVYQDLHGTRAKAMWQMFCERKTDLEVSCSNVEANDQTGKAHWEAIYTFSVTGNKVHNKIDAAYRFKDGKISWHHDTFDFWKWTQMALGTKGLLLGWTPYVQNTVRKTAEKNLTEFMNKKCL